MNTFDSDYTPVEKPVEGASLRDALLAAVENVSPDNPIDVAVPAGMKEDEWVSIFNKCYTKRGDFAHVGQHIRVSSRNENNGVVLVLTDRSKKLEIVAEMRARFDPKPESPSEWPVGPATPPPEDNLSE